MAEHPNHGSRASRALDYQSVVRTPRPGFGNPLDYAPRPRWPWARRFLRTWSVVLLTLPALAGFFAWIFLVIWG